MDQDTLHFLKPFAMMLHYFRYPSDMTANRLRKPNSLPTLLSLASCLLALVIQGNNDANAQSESPPLGSTQLGSTQPPNIDLPLREFRPIPQLVVEHQSRERPAFQVVDVHTHFQIRLKHDTQSLDRFVELMDRNQIALCVSLDGTLGERLANHQRYLLTKYPNRFAIFANIDFVGSGKPDAPATWDCNQPDFIHRTCEQMKQVAKDGVCGLKLFKQFGLEYRNADGSLISIDDPRFDPIWATCSELSWPVIMHTADPSAFFLPIDATNERFEELSRRPEWAFPPDRFPSRRSLHEARNRVIERHPQTKFIAAHLGNDGENLAETASWLERYPNLYVEIASRISELGRQPFSARRFLIKYQDRVLFGTDGPWPEARLKRYWQFLETEDEYFPYSEKEVPPQGLWNIYGVNLPPEVLQKIYHDNALHLIPALRDKFAHTARSTQSCVPNQIGQR